MQSLVLPQSSYGRDNSPQNLAVDARLTEASGHAERIAALDMIEPRADRPTTITLGADEAYDPQDFVNELRLDERRAVRSTRTGEGGQSAIDGRTTRHAGHAVSQRIRERIEEVFGWVKTVAGNAKSQIPQPGRLGFRFRGVRLQSGAPAQASGGGMSAAANCRLIGRWRIIEADLWDRAYLDLWGPATITITAQGGKITFGAMRG